MTQPTSLDAITQRLYTFHREAFYKIRPILPPPFEETPESYAARDQAVIEAIVQLVPVNASETELAAMAVAGNQLWMHFMREARRAEDNPKEHDRLTGQAARSGRDARGFLAALERVQKARTKREVTPASAERADILEENGRRLMLAALDDPPRGMQPPLQSVQPAAATPSCTAPAPDLLTAARIADAAPTPSFPQPAPATPPDSETTSSEPPLPAQRDPSSAESAPATVLHLVPVPRVVPPPVKASHARPTDDDEPETNWDAEADFYAKIYPDRARLIRKLGRLPNPCDFGPPEAQLLHAIIVGTTPELLALDIPDAAAEERLRRYARRGFSANAG